MYRSKNWRIKVNKKIDILIEHTDTVNFVKSLMMRWLGHVERMNNNRMPKMILSANMDGGRSRVCPRKQ
jgi:hypothetical protein